MATWTESLTNPVDWLAQSDTVSKWDVGKSWHLSTDPVNASATRDTLWDEEPPGEGGGHHVTSITKLQDSWGWFASLLTEVVTGKKNTSPPRPQTPGISRLWRACTRRWLYPSPTAHVAQRCESCLSVFAKQNLKYQHDGLCFSVSMLNTTLQGYFPSTSGKLWTAYPRRWVSIQVRQGSAGLHSSTAPKTEIEAENRGSRK